MSSEVSFSLKLQPLTLANYVRWVVEMERVLEVRDLWCAVTEGAEYSALPDDAARVKESRTVNIFCCCISLPS
jgi:hypothetical protein